MGFVLIVKVDEQLRARGWTQADLAEKTGLRPSTISEIVRGSRTVINKEHIAKIAEVMGITDITELIELKSTDKG
ncbi:helix-turn-helix domain-containing protein [Brevibacillus porteri]|uniref:XRE family transcriptional regulator n=1 Tax=Brevibacillus porteri TaxID=2126350 RepID=A0ABX5FHG5_9BACL|nr:helix-turn-helix transcriptional regulator [Brevibacillus porteri]MED1802924.1 helix-turn-helix transcriptional regulator [Brevibacillus porteri]MED2135100.1 helix-turn-helix transcriptional regulator [Brevibacillus porteri]MED2746342.1 helix-turn-helix transcriptional regulator [Brevibacillus porteri]MED2817926.1 helix-turn-helix transcriptional regulator [Brevibacillus porteri]MED2895558.1 helix-turn-helix transcriptional regulator [Brevibacillus porteri]